MSTFATVAMASALVIDVGLAVAFVVVLARWSREVTRNSVERVSSRDRALLGVVHPRDEEEEL